MGARATNGGDGMNAVWDWWLSLWPDHGLIGPLIALVVAVAAVLIAGNAIIWPIAWIKAAISGRSEPQDAHEELGVVDERPVDHR